MNKLDTRYINTTTKLVTTVSDHGPNILNTVRQHLDFLYDNTSTLCSQTICIGIIGACQTTEHVSHEKVTLAGETTSSKFPRFRLRVHICAGGQTTQRCNTGNPPACFRWSVGTFTSLVDVELKWKPHSSGASASVTCSTCMLLLSPMMT